MPIIRQYIAPLITLIIFLFTFLVVNTRIFADGDMAAPAPVEQVQNTTVSNSNHQPITNN